MNGFGFIKTGWLRFLVLVVYYVAIMVGLVILYGRGDFTTPPFIYQGF